MKTRAAQSFVILGLAMMLAGCGLFGVKGPGLEGSARGSLRPECTTPPYELPASCPLGGIGADLQTFKDSHLYAGSTVLIPGNTNFLSIQTKVGRVVSFEEQFHATPPLSDHEAGIVARGEVPSDGRKLFTKTVGGMCQVLEYKSAALRREYGKSFSAVRIVLRSADPTVFAKNDVATAAISLTAPHSAASVKSC